MTEKNSDMPASETVTPIAHGDEIDAVEVVAVEEAPVKKIDLMAFLNGVTPTRRTVRLYGNGGARADLDVIDRQISEAKARRQQAQVNRLQKERVAAIQTLKSENVMDVTLVGWTEAKSDSFAKELDAAKVTSILERNLSQVAAQVVEIDGTNVSEGGLTPTDICDLLLDLYKIPGMQPQIDRLVRVTVEANADPEQITVPL